MEDRPKIRPKAGDVGHVSGVSGFPISQTSCSAPLSHHSRKAGTQVRGIEIGNH